MQRVVLAADMELAEGILRHARRLQDHLVEQIVRTAGRGFDVLRGDGVGRGAGLRLDAVARRIQALGGDDHGFDRAGILACDLCKGCGVEKQNNARGTRKQYGT